MIGLNVVQVAIHCSFRYTDQIEFIAVVGGCKMSYEIQKSRFDPVALAVCL